MIYWIIAYIISYFITYWYLAKTYKDCFSEYEMLQSRIIIAILSMMSFITILVAGVLFWLFDID